MPATIQIPGSNSTVQIIGSVPVISTYDSFAKNDFQDTGLIVHGTSSAQFIRTVPAGLVWEIQEFHTNSSVFYEATLIVGGQTISDHLGNPYTNQETKLPPRPPLAAGTQVIVKYQNLDPSRDASITHNLFYRESTTP